MATQRTQPTQSTQQQQAKKRAADILISAGMQEAASNLMGGAAVETPVLVSANGAPVAAPSMAGSMAALAPYAGAVAGTYLLGKGAKDLAEGKKGDTASRAQLGWTTGGLSEVARMFGLGDGDKWKTEGDRLKKLAENGTFIPEELLANIAQGPRSKDELIRHDLAPDFVGKDDKGGWVNNKFAQSRDENDLTAEDKWGYSSFFELFPDWMKKSEEDRRRIAGAAKVNEHHGTMDILNADELKAMAATPVAAPAQTSQSSGGASGNNSTGPKRKPTPGRPAPPPIFQPPEMVPPTVAEIEQAYMDVYNRNRTPKRPNPLLENPYLYE